MAQQVSQPVFQFGSSLCTLIRYFLKLLFVFCIVVDMLDKLG